MTDFRAELQKLVTAYDDHGGKWPQEDADALCAAVQRARVALAEPEPEGPTDEELRNIWETGHLPTEEELANDDGECDLQFLFTSAYYRWLEEYPDAMAQHEAKCLRAVFNAGRNWPQPH